MKRQFHPNDDEDDKAVVIKLLEKMASNPESSKVLEQHLELIQTMARSDVINKVESHQKKSLK